MCVCVWWVCVVGVWVCVWGGGGWGGGGGGQVHPKPRQELSSLPHPRTELELVRVLLPEIPAREPGPREQPAREYLEAKYKNMHPARCGKNSV